MAHYYTTKQHMLYCDYMRSIRGLPIAICFERWSIGFYMAHYYTTKQHMLYCDYMRSIRGLPIAICFERWGRISVVKI